MTNLSSEIYADFILSIFKGHILWPDSNLVMHVLVFYSVNRNTNDYWLGLTPAMTRVNLTLDSTVWIG